MRPRVLSKDVNFEYQQETQALFYKLNFAKHISLPASRPPFASGIDKRRAIIQVAEGCGEKHEKRRIQVGVPFQRLTAGGRGNAVMCIGHHPVDVLSLQEEPGGHVELGKVRKARVVGNFPDDNGIGQLPVALNEGAHAGLQRFIAEPAHLGDPAADSLDIALQGLFKMS